MTGTEARTIFDEPPDDQAEARQDAQAEADDTAGRIIAHERVREWLQRLIRGEKTPPPAA